MKNKMLYLIKISLEKKVKTKWFLIANIIFLVLIAGLLNIDNIVKSFGGDFENKTKIMVIDEAGVYNELLNIYKENSNSLTEKSELIKYKKSLKDAKNEIKEDNDKIILLLQNNSETYLNAEIISYDGVDILLATVISNSLTSIKNNIIARENALSENIIQALKEPISIKSERLDKKNTDSYSETITNVLFPIIILPFFMLSMFLIGMIGAEVNEEKTSKSMEIIISNVSPKVHFFSKVLAGNIFVLMQSLLLIIYAVIGVLIRFIISGPNLLGSIPTEATDILNVLTESSIFDKLPVVIPVTITLMLLTFLGYSLLAGILASMTTNQEDYQQLQTPIILISLVGYYISMMASVFEGSIFIKIISYVPFISSVLSPVLLFLGQISLLDIFISITLMVLTIYLLIKYGLKIYKVGILNYSSSSLWKKMFKAVKNK